MDKGLSHRASLSSLFWDKGYFAGLALWSGVLLLFSSFESKMVSEVSYMKAYFGGCILLGVTLIMLLAVHLYTDRKKLNRSIIRWGALAVIYVSVVISGQNSAMIGKITGHPCALQDRELANLALAQEVYVRQKNTFATSCEPLGPFGYPCSPHVDVIIKIETQENGALSYSAWAHHKMCDQGVSHWNSAKGGLAPYRMFTTIEQLKKVVGY